MQSERQRILELVAEGTITVAQAEDLLAALDDEARSTSTTVLAAKEQPAARGRQAKSEGAGYVQALKELGITPSLDELIKLRSESVTPEYVHSMREAGLEDLSSGALISMITSGLDADTLRTL